MNVCVPQPHVSKALPRGWYREMTGPESGALMSGTRVLVEGPSELPGPCCCPTGAQ